MRRDSWWPGDDAVSPVIGVVLMVGIAVTLMATIGVFVLGVGPGEQTPRGEVLFSQEDTGNVTITVADGAGLVADELSVQVGTEEACLDNDEWDGSLEPGDRVTVWGAGSGCNALTNGDTVQVIWSASNGGRSEIIDQYEYI